MRNVEKRLEAAAELLSGLREQELPPAARETVAQALTLIEQTIEQEERDHGI